jgi:hypothetical protein
VRLGKRKYRMVLDEQNKRFIIEKKVDLLFIKYWSRRYLRNNNDTFYHTEEHTLARKIVNILNGNEHLI